MRLLLIKAWAFVVRDFRIESGYKINFILQMMQSLLLLIFFYFLGELITPRSSEGLAGLQYFPFALVGLAFSRYFELTLRMFSESIRLAQVSGCLEAMLSSQTGCISIVLMSSLYGLISGAIQLNIILFIGGTAFGVDFGHINVLAAVTVFAVSNMIFVAFGILSATAVMWLKKGDPVTWFLGVFGSVISGAYFPIDVMPSWMQKVASLIPITHALDALRFTLLKNYSLSMVARPLGILAGTSVILLPLSIALFASAVRKGRREGTLTHY